MGRTILAGQSLIVLGKGLSGDPKKPETVGMNIHSTLNAIAAGLLFTKEKAKELIIAGGKTKGENCPSESHVMKEYIIKEFGIPGDKIFIEEDSIDTSGNAEYLLVKGFLQINTKARVLTLSQHLERSGKLFWNIARVKIRPISAQEVIEQYGSYEQKILADRFNDSDESRWETRKEKILNILMIFDPKGKWLRKNGELLRKVIAKLRHET